MTEADAIAAQTAMLAGRLDAIIAGQNSLETAISELTLILTAPMNVLAEAVGRSYWLATIAVMLILTYVVVRVLWVGVFRQILRW